MNAKSLSCVGAAFAVFALLWTSFSSPFTFLSVGSRPARQYWSIDLSAAWQPSALVKTAGAGSDREALGLV